MRAPLLLCLSLLLAAGSAFGWGCEGHQMVALIARAHLTPAVSAAVDQLLTQNPIDPAVKRFCQDAPADLMADSATWADDVRNAAKTGLWHYVDIPLTVKERTSLAPWCPPVGPLVDNKDRAGCVTSALEYHVAILRDTTKPASERATALRYIIHFAGDIHQPLHDSDNDDKGGNCTSIQFFAEDRASNLHSIWDSKLIQHDLTAKKTTTTAYAQTLDQKFAAEGAAWRNEKSDPTDWAWEGHQVALTTTYGDLNPLIPVESPGAVPECNAERDKVAALHIKIGDKYFDDAMPKVDEQIAKAGNRLAALLNRTL